MKISLAQLALFSVLLLNTHVLCFTIPFFPIQPFGPPPMPTPIPVPVFPPVPPPRSKTEIFTYCPWNPNYGVQCTVPSPVPPRTGIPQPYPDWKPRFSCAYLPLNIGKIQESDLKYLKKYFSNFEDNNFQIAKYLWQQSASQCSPLSEAELFSQIVKVHKKFDQVESTLESSNIKQSNTKVYTVKQFTDALSGLFEGKAILLYCADAQTDADGNQTKPQVLLSINISLDAKVYNSYKKTSECNDGFIYPKQK